MSSVKDLLRGDVVDGSGTANNVAKWSDADTITDSIIYDDGTNIGIGTSSPAANLEIVGGATDGNGLKVTGNVASGYIADFIYPGTINGGIRISANTAQTVSSSIYISNRNLRISNDTSGYDILFNTSGSERMRITSGGDVQTFGSSDALFISHSGAANTSLNLIIGKHSATGTGTGTTSFVVRTNGNVENTNNSYGSLSDAKLKENIVDATPKLDDLLKVKVRNYNLIGEERKQIGVVAQELEEVFPSMIDESPDYEEQEVIDEEGNSTKQRVDLGTTTKSVKYSVFVPMLIKAMQEQQEIINDLKARIETLESQINA